MEFLKANGIEDHSFVKEMDYQEVLNSQEIYGDELQMFAKKELQKEVSGINQSFYNYLGCTLSLLWLFSIKKIIINSVLVHEIITNNLNCAGCHTEGRQWEAGRGDSREWLGLHAPHHRAGQPLSHRTCGQVWPPQHWRPGQATERLGRGHPSPNIFSRLFGLFYPFESLFLKCFRVKF